MRRISLLVVLLATLVSFSLLTDTTRAYACGCDDGHGNSSQDSNHGGNDRDGHDGHANNDGHGNGFRGSQGEGRKTIQVAKGQDDQGNRDDDRDRRDNDKKNDDQRHGVTVVRHYTIDVVNPFTTVVCGVTFNGWLKEHQEYNLLSNGLLNFKYVAVAEAHGTDAQGHKVDMKINNFEIDHIFQDVVPDLAPYYAAHAADPLASWVNDHLSIVCRVDAGFQMIITSASGGPRLVNRWTFMATHTGVKVDTIYFVATNCG